MLTPSGLHQALCPDGTLWAETLQLSHAWPGRWAGMPGPSSLQKPHPHPGACSVGGAAAWHRADPRGTASPWYPKKGFQQEQRHWGVSSMALSDPASKPRSQLQWERAGRIHGPDQSTRAPTQLAGVQCGVRVRRAPRGGPQGQRPGRESAGQERRAHPVAERHQPDPEAGSCATADPHQVGGLHQRREGQGRQEPGLPAPG